jgi:hypothetical protein
MIDNRTFKCYDMTEDNMLHLGQVSSYLDELDFRKTNDT